MFDGAQMCFCATLDGLKLNLCGELIDGKKLVRMVSFDPSLQSEMKKAQESESVVAVANCQVKQSQDCGELEVVSKRSKVRMSPRKFGPIA